jgi:hypothetical protein
MRRLQYVGMTLLRVRLALFVVMVLGTSVRADTLSETRSTLEKWVETRQLISRTRADWQADKEVIGQTIDLLERELRALDEQFARLGTNSVQVEKERLQAEASLKASNDSLERTQQFAAAFEGQLSKLVSRLPAPLQEILKPSLNKLPADSAKTGTTAMVRLQTIVTILGEIDKFNNAVTIFSETRVNQKGEEVAVETVYVGLGAAYFVNDANDFAGAGFPGPTGWEWAVKPEWAASVREAIRIYRNERGARFVGFLP